MREVRTSGSTSGFGNILDVLRYKAGHDGSGVDISGIRLGTVLYVFKQGEKVPHLSDWSAGASIKKDVKLARVICHVDGVTDHIPGFTQEDLDASANGSLNSATILDSSIGRFPVFVARNDTLVEPAVGDAILVSWTNLNGVYYGVYEDFVESGHAATGSSGSPGSAGTSGSDYSSASVGRGVYMSKGTVPFVTRESSPIVSVLNGIKVVDCRKVFELPKNYTHDRALSKISGFVLHRTACILGENYRRWEKVNAHIGVTMGGTIFLMHGWDRLIWHGHAPSATTIGIEFDGNPDGIPGRYWKKGGGPHPITSQQVKASRVLYDLVASELIMHRASLRDVIAHRQSTDQRGYDPGWECWQKIALPWMERSGKNDPSRVWGSGRTIPVDWDPSSPHKFGV